MSLFRGSLTYVRFFVEGDLPEDFRERFMRSIRVRIMKPLEVEDEDLERSGWCKPGDPFALELAYDDVFYNEYIVLGMRTDRWRIPGSTLRARLKEAEQAYLQKKGRERVTRKERAELKEFVSKRLRRETSASTRLVDAAWSLNEGVVRFISHGPKPAATFQEIFHKTFGSHGVKLVPEAPYTLAARLGMSKVQESAWQELDMTLLAEEEG